MKHNLYLSACIFESLVDGEGIRTVLFFSGCNHQCKGCHSPETHSFINGEKITEDLIESIKKEIYKRPYITGITLSGGDPMYSAEAVIEFLEVLDLDSKYDIWIYSGFTLDQIKQDKYKAKLLNKCDYLVDGRFKLEERDITSSCKFRGSKNQNIYKKTKFNNWKLLQ